MEFDGAKLLSSKAEREQYPRFRWDDLNGGERIILYSHERKWGSVDGFRDVCLWPLSTISLAKELWRGQSMC